MILGIHPVQITVSKGAEDDARAFYFGIMGLEEAPRPASFAERGGFGNRVERIQVL